MTVVADYDVVILGSGPAGLQAAIHAARRKVNVLVLGKEAKSSLFHAHVENFCCIFNLAGDEMLGVGREQAARFGAHIRDEDVLRLEGGDGGFSVQLEGGDDIRCRSLVLATGTNRNRLGVPGEKALLGRGVSYCVECDCNFYRGQAVAVVGSGSAAADGALTMLDYAKEVHLVTESLEVNDHLAAKLRESAVQIHSGAKVEAISGGDAVEGLKLSDGSLLPVDGVFIELGAKGVMDLITPLGVMLDDEMKYIRTNKQQETNIDGIYAAGDICGPPWQMAKAVGEGCVAGLAAAGYAKKLKAGR